MYILGVQKGTSLPQHSINRIYDSLSIPETALLNENQWFRSKPAAEAFLTSQPATLLKMPSSVRRGDHFESSSIFPLVDNYSGGANPPPIPTELAHAHSATCPHVECMQFRRAVKRNNYLATTSLASARVADLMVIE